MCSAHMRGTYAFIIMGVARKVHGGRTTWCAERLVALSQAVFLRAQAFLSSTEFTFASLSQTSERSVGEEGGRGKRRGSENWHLRSIPAPRGILLVPRAVRIRVVLENFSFARLDYVTIRRHVTRTIICRNDERRRRRRRR